MYKTIAEAVDFIERIKPVAAQASHCEVIVAPPFAALAAAAAAAKGSKVLVAAQNCHWDKEGAHTGDVSAEMVRDALNEEGKSGWELVQFGYHQKEMMCVWKRIVG